MPWSNPVFLAVLATWTAIEFALLVRDQVQSKGSTEQDRGTRLFYVAAWLAAFLIAHELLSRHWPGSGLALGRWSLIAGLVLMSAGLAVRVWAVLSLGVNFRTTVEVEQGQAVVDRGPYRFVRHPSYTGLTIIAVGVGLASGNVVVLAVFIVLPFAAVLRRVAVEEAALTQVIGQPYVTYQEHTKRLVPGVW